MFGNVIEICIRSLCIYFNVIWTLPALWIVKRCTLQELEMKATAGSADLRFTCHKYPWYSEVSNSQVPVRRPMVDHGRWWLMEVPWPWRFGMKCHGSKWINWSNVHWRWWTTTRWRSKSRHTSTANVLRTSWIIMQVGEGDFGWMHFFLRNQHLTK